MAFPTPAQGRGGPRHLATPAGRLGLVLTNQDPANAFTARITIAPGAAHDHDGGPFHGHRYTGGSFDVRLPDAQSEGGVLTVTLPPLSIEFWLQF